jgi:ribosomal protein L16 Arg81 hydroxylase
MIKNGTSGSVHSLESLDTVLSPIKSAHFLREFYCRTPLYIRGDPDRFSSLLSWDGLNRATTLQRKHRPPFRLAKDGKILPQQQFSNSINNSNGEFWSINFRSVRRLLEEGATLLVDRIDETHEPLADFCRMLEAELGSYAFADAFASWRQTQGFPTHWDAEEVFVVQLIGTKHWRVLKPERLHPTQQDKGKHNQSPPLQSYWEGDMSPGDLLYIPGGWWHDALAVSDRTLHVAFGLCPPTGLTVINAMLRALQENELARTPLPRFASELEQQDYMSHLRSAVDEQMRGFTIKSVLQNLDSRAPARTRLSMPWSALSETEAIPARAWIHWLPPRRLAVKEAGDEIIIEAIGERFTFAAVALSVVRDLVSHRKLPFSEICSRHSQLPVENILLRLVSAGLVAIADDSVV